MIVDYNMHLREASGGREAVRRPVGDVYPAPEFREALGKAVLGPPSHKARFTALWREGQVGIE